MTPEEFVATFNGRITVMFNWHRFVQERWPVSVQHLRDRSDFERCFLPWYLNAAGQHRPNATQDDQPLQVSVIPVRRRSNALPEPQRGGIESYVTCFQQTMHPIVFSIPAYRL